MMLLEIASITIDIDNSLIHKSIFETLKPFQKKNTGKCMYSIKPLGVFPKYIQQGINRANNRYYENKDTICIANKHSICNFSKDLKIFEIAPALGIGHPKYNILVDLKLFLSEIAISMGGFLFHAAGLQIENSIYCFTGPSGAGKSTISDRLKAYAQIINDELLIILPKHGQYLAHSSPFGKKGTGKKNAASAPLKKIFYIKKSTVTRSKQIKDKKAIFSILSGVCHFPTSESTSQKLFDNVLKIAYSLPCSELYFSLNDLTETLYEKVL